MSAFPIKIFTPEKEIYQGEASIISAKTLSGEVGIMSGHIPLFAALPQAAAVSITTSAGLRLIAAIGEGFLSVSKTEVIILAQFCTWVSDTDTEIDTNSLKEGSKEHILAVAHNKAVAHLHRL